MLVLHLAQAARLHVVHEAAHAVGARDERARLDAGDRLAHVLVEVAERLGRPLWLDPCLLLDLTAEVVVAKGEHPPPRVRGSCARRAARPCMPPPPASWQAGVTGHLW